MFLEAPFFESEGDPSIFPEDRYHDSNRGSRLMTYQSPSHVATPTPDYPDAGELHLKHETSPSSSKGSPVFPVGNFDETDFADTESEGTGPGGSMCRTESEDTASERGGATRTTAEGGLDVSDILFAFKRRSRSFESLIDSFREDHNFQHLFREDPHLSSLQSLADSSDDDSDPEGEGEAREGGGMAAAAAVVSSSSSSREVSAAEGGSSVLECSLSDSVSEHDCSSSFSCSLDASQLSELSDGGVVIGSAGARQCDDPLPIDMHFARKSLSFDDRSAMSVLNADILRQWEHSTVDDDVCPLPNLAHDGEPLLKEGAGPKQNGEESQKNSKVKRSKSQESSSRNAVRRKAVRARANVFLRKQKQGGVATTGEAPPTLATLPTDMLLQFQIASMGCAMGVESKAELRAVVKESETNSEKDNYSISQERE